MIISKTPNNLLVTESTKLVEARYNLSLDEQRLVYSMVAFIQPDDKEFKKYEINIKELAALLNKHEANVYKGIESILHRIMERVIHIELDDGRGWLKTHWVSSARYIKGSGIIELSFEPELKPYLLQLRSQFTTMSLNTLVQFRSIYTIRMYAILKANQYKQFVDFYYQNLRETLGIGEDEYLLYKNFRNRILDQAKKEFQEKDKNGMYKSDVSFELEILERRNRKIYKIRLHIIENKIQTPLPLALEVKPVTKENNPVIEKLIYYGIAIKQAHTLIKKHKETIQGSIELFEKNLNDNKIKKNKSGYLITLIASNAGIQSQYEKSKQEDKRNKIKQKERESKEKQEKIAKFKDNTIKLFTIIEKIKFSILKDKIKEIINSSPFINNHMDISLELDMVNNATNFNQLITIYTPHTDAPLSKHVLQTLQGEYLPKE